MYNGRQKNWKENALPCKSKFTYFSTSQFQLNICIPVSRLCHRIIHNRYFKQFLAKFKKKAVSCRTIQTATPFVVSGLLLYLRQQNSTIFYANALKTLPTVQSKCFWHYRMHDFSSVTRLCTHWEKVALFIQMSSQSRCFIFLVDLRVMISYVITSSMAATVSWSTYMCAFTF
jgi:hypothetical protein